MAESIYRKKNLDRMKSPDTLDRYIQVANPGGWVLLVSILCLMIGVIVWGMFGTIETTIETETYFQGETATVAMDAGLISEIEKGMPVRVGDEIGTVYYVLKDESTIVVKAAVPNGVYDAEIITESIQPMSLIFD